MASASSDTDPGPESSGDGPYRRVLLLGFMASGKSTVGRRVARALGWRLADADAEVERRSGSTIPEIFAREGEAGFRRREAAVVDELLDLSECVVVPGGGWAAAAPDRLTGLPADTLSVWLRVSPEEAVRRALAEGPGRPLLDEAADPVAEARRLLAERAPFYRQARLHLDTGGTGPVDVADLIIRAVRCGHAAADR